MDNDFDFTGDDDADYEREDRFWRGFARAFFIMTAVFLLMVGLLTVASDPLSSIPILLGSLVIGVMSRAIK